jgi:hypothetical protein
VNADNTDDKLCASNAEYIQIETTEADHTGTNATMREMQKIKPFPRLLEFPVAINSQFPGHRLLDEPNRLAAKSCIRGAAMASEVARFARCSL